MFVMCCLVLVTLFQKFSAVYGVMFQNSVDEPCFYEQRMNGRLVKLDGVKVGYHRYLNLDDDERKYHVITKSLKPTIFEIPNFLSGTECDHIKTLAEKNGLKDSVAGFDKHAYQGEIKDVLEKSDNENYILRLPEFMDHFHEWDKNKDLVITLDELKGMCRRANGLHLSEDEIIDMFHQINYTLFDDGKMNEEEFNILPMNKLDAFLIFTKHKHPFHRPRYSKHTWLKNERLKDTVLRKLNERIIKLTQLPRKIVESSEDIQVVRYGVNGHYHSHYDSTPESNSSLVCCHQNHARHKECKLCRIITLLVYLNDVKKGGETAFPVANNNKTLFAQDLIYSNSLDEAFNLSKGCHRSNLVVGAKKGTAIMWYNHEVDSKTHWLGDIDIYSVHGGCDVLEGEKWAANAWINAPTAQSAHVTSLFG